MRRLFAVLVFLVAPQLFAQADQQIVSVTDSPDPVVPGSNVTYTITARNNGPSPAVNGGVQALFGDMNYVSMTGPAGFTCSVFGNAASCTNPSWAAGGDQVFTLVLQMPPHLISFADGSRNVSFMTTGTTIDPVPGNNNDTETTSYDSPQIDVAVTVSDSPDPVGPDADITYTADVINNGPDAGTNAQFSTFQNNTLRFQSATIPAGWNCTLPSVNGNPTFSCTKPTIASGETAQFVVVVRASSAVLGINDGSVQMGFTANATGDDTNDDNNTETETTAYVTPDANLAITVSDSPDPVGPNGNITYTGTMTNLGPDTATNVNFNVFNNGSLRFQSATLPAGWNCTFPAVNGVPSFTCTLASFPSGAIANFTVVLRADPAVLGINDTSVQTVFSANSQSVADPVSANNSETETTNYVTPDADLTIAVTDSPDPVTPDNNITYTVTVNNLGPDTATNVNFNVFNNGSLRFQSATVPAGWNCTLPAVNATPTFTCTAATFGNGASSVFTIVVRANQSDIGIFDTTLTTSFSVGSQNVADPVPGNNTENESTQYVTPDANLAITASDSPDPVANGSNVTYTIAASNAGPDAAPNTQATFSMSPSLLFQSLTAPAGWSCTTPAVGATGVVTCTNASFASGGSANFSLAGQLSAAGAGGTISSTFGVSSGAQDPNTANNNIEVFTNWIGQSSDLSVTKTTLSTAAAQGSTITYTISTSNAGPSAATNAQITDTLPAQLLFQSITAPAGWTCVTPAAGANGTITCTNPSFANGATANFTLVTTVAPNATGSISNSAAVSSANTDPTPGNSSGASGAVVVAGNADLGVTKTTTSTNVAPGAAVSYTVTVANAGPDAAASVVMTDVLPAQLLFQSITAPAGWTCTTPAIGANGTVTCNAATLASGANAVFTLNTTVANNATGTITNTASAGHSGTDGNGGNSSGSSPGVVVTPATSSDLSIVKDTAATTVSPGQTFSYTITVNNAGPDAAANATMTDTLPASLLFQSISTPAGWTCTTPAAGASGTITCSIASFPVGSGLFTLNVQVAPGATGTITNAASIASATSDPNGGNNTSTTAPIPVATASADLSITKTTPSTFTTPGATLNYTITVSNGGPSAATNVVVTDTLPAGVTLNSATPSQGTCSGTTAITCTLGTLNAGASATIALSTTVTAPNGSTINNSASVTSATADPNPGNNTGNAPSVPVGTEGPAAAIPTLSEWMLIALALMLAAAAAMKMR